MNKMTIVILALVVSACGAVAVKPVGNISDYYLKAESAYAKNNYVLAKQGYEKVIQAYPNNTEALFKLGNISMRYRNWAHALNYYSQVLRIKPSHAKAHHNLAMLHLYQAKNHLNYYIANNDSFENKKLGKLIESIIDYSKNKQNKKSPLEKLAEAVKTRN